MPEGLQLQLRTRGAALVADAGAPPALPVEVPGEGGLEVEVTGAPAGAALRLLLGEDGVELFADEGGVARWSDDGWLNAAAGRLSVAVVREDPLSSERASAELQVVPTKLTAASLVALIDDLESWAAGLIADFAGRTQAEVALRDTPESVLVALEQVAASVAEAAVWVRRRPLGRPREEVTASAAVEPRLQARDLAWLARHPAPVARIAATGRDAAVVRRRHHDLDVPENRGVLWLFDRLAALADEVDGRLRREIERLRAGQAAREAFRTLRSTLWAERDLPRMNALLRRRRKLDDLREELALARLRANLPERLPREALRRSAHVEAHPGYWGLYRAWERVRTLELGAARPAFVPVDNVDRLYEMWCVLALASALGAVIGRAPDELLRLDDEGWFARLPAGELCAVAWGDAELRLHYEPRYGWLGGDGYDADVGRLLWGAPLCPDLVIEVRRADQAPELHVFDAKHRLGPAHGKYVPEDAVREIWWKYGDAIGWRASRQPVVASVWVLFPGPIPVAWSRAPGMQLAGWPEGRVRAGAVAVKPGMDEGHRRLEGLLRVLLGVPAPGRGRGASPQGV